MDAPRCYVTTPIYYVTAAPHLGHAYTTVVADALSRYHRMRGDTTAFLTGTDEHGQKVERMAAESGKPPAEFAEAISREYQRVFAALHIEPDDFIRTTEPRHEEVVKEIWRRMEAAGDIYFRDYESWYCVPCEQFYLDKELAPDNRCPVHARPVERVREKNYFFRLSKYQDWLLRFYEEKERAGKPFIVPAVRMNEVRSFVESGLEDFSISRTNFKWGIPVPGHPEHVIYVWMDALTNYYSATRDPKSKVHGFWDDGVDIVHLMGKEITRFHAVYWPAMLHSAGLRCPDRIVAHGWWTVDGEKMSKTRGNVVDPARLAEDLGADAFRYFVMREVPLGADGDFSHAALLQRYNSELANDLGNLLNRTLGMVVKYLGADVTWRQLDEESLVAACRDGVAAYDAALQEYAPSRALDAVWQLVRSGNEYVERSAPWKQSKPDQEVILWNALELCRQLAHLIAPFLPERAAEMQRQLGVDEKPQLPRWRSGHAFRVRPGSPLFPRVDEDRRKELLAKWASRPEPESAATQQAAAAQQIIAKQQIEYADFQRLDLRVARIAEAERIPKKDKLLKLSVDLGGEKRQVVAGIAAAYAPESLVGRRVIFLANLKPAKIGGVLSEGMILAAGEEEILALSALDRDCPPGTRVR
jgi:methionyl-tRNA synthetase